MSAPGPTTPELHWAGTEAFLLDCADLAEVTRWHAHLTRHPLPGQVDVVAAARTVLVVFTGAGAAREAAGAVATARPAASRAASGKTVEIPVVYDGADLAEVARLTGRSEQGVVETHTGAAWTAAFGGFAPGFAYLTAAGDPLDVPRRDSPRTAVPAGSVALAGTFSAVYPRSSPGGWQLIGRTDAVLWDERRDPPALIRPGDTVRYRAVRELVAMTEAGNTHGSGAAGDDAAGHVTAAGAGSERPDCHRTHRSHPTDPQPEAPGDPAAEGAARCGLVVEEPGMQTLVQDLGRPGLGDLGVSASGAADRVSAAQANRLVGNAEGDAVLEVTLGGLSVTARGHQVLALSGAPVTATIRTPVGDERPPLSSTAAEATGSPPDLSGVEPGQVTRPSTPSAEGRTRPAPFCAPFALYDGERLTLGAPTSGLRSYAAVRGGVDVPAVLGSRSTDVLSGVGPAPLARGDEVAVRRVVGGRAVARPERPAVAAPRGETPVLLRISPGPRADWFAPHALETLTDRTWTVGSASNRVGVRFETPGDGKVLERARTGELASEGVVAGSLQVPHSGVPVLFLADHPVTGGYPVVAVVLPEDLPLAAQLTPGCAVRFRLAPPGPRSTPATAPTGAPPPATTPPAPPPRPAAPPTPPPTAATTTTHTGDTPCRRS
ncbi:urea amidolyase family protein [Kocuria sp.]|uniref:5-oxoprolinase subunit B/C family protein n=1 Tax=Kocuria sp. TaxID=1871328 RepID=UPI0026DB4FAE|nr:urea amidolyase family protein [Kocuria sp.]MDO4918914.1 urea amidolyase family protein [Kocuria sp.]